MGVSVTVAIDGLTSLVVEQEHVVVLVILAEVEHVQHATRVHVARAAAEPAQTEVGQPLRKVDVVRVTQELIELLLIRAVRALDLPIDCGVRALM
jgi:hypothetical protein